MSLTTDRNDPDLKITEPSGMQKKYLVLSEEERAKGFVRPVRQVYVHVGRPAPKYPLRDMTDEEKERYGNNHAYVKYEQYPESESPAVGKAWRQDELDKVNAGCGAETRMGLELSETYARNPHFYGATYCVGCGTHLKVGSDGEFIWKGTNERVGT